MLVEGRKQTAWDSFRRMLGVAVDRKSIKKLDPLFCTSSFTIILLCWEN
jgi:hypothetical protein